jgi:hypothetical protein
MSGSHNRSFATEKGQMRDSAVVQSIPIVAHNQEQSAQSSSSELQEKPDGGLDGWLTVAGS